MGKTKKKKKSRWIVYFWKLHELRQMWVNEDICTEPRQIVRLSLILVKPRRGEGKVRPR